MQDPEPSEKADPDPKKNNADPEHWLFCLIRTENKPNIVIPHIPFIFHQHI